MRVDAHLSPRLATAYLLIGLVASAVALILLLTGRTGTMTWMAVGWGLALLLVGAAQRSSLRHRPHG